MNDLQHLISDSPCQIFFVITLKSGLDIKSLYYLDARTDREYVEVIIPYEKLSREGTDSGYAQKSLEENVERVKKQLQRGDAFIVYDEATQTANIVSKKYLEQKNNPIHKNSGT